MIKQSNKCSLFVKLSNFSFLYEQSYTLDNGKIITLAMHYNKIFFLKDCLLKGT